MRIACVAYLHGFGGAERQIIELSNQMAVRGHEVHLIILAEDKICYNLNSEVKIHSLVESETGRGLLRIYRRRKALLALLKGLHCDITVNFNLQSAYLLAFENKKKIGKIIYSERGDPGDKEYTGLLGLVRSFTLSHIDGFVFQSEGARDYFKNSHVLNNCIVIPNACFLKPQKPFAGTRRKIIANVGRLSEQKNQALLICAFSMISGVFPDYNLEIYGEGELKNSLNELVKEMNLTQRVFFKGACKDVLDRIKDVSLFVLSSDYEGIPNALIEAMAIGLPCISTDCKPGGARTLIKNGYNGIITSRGNADELSEAMRRLLIDVSYAAKIGDNARAVAEVLSPVSIYNEWENFLLGIVNNKA